MPLCVRFLYRRLRLLAFAGVVVVRRRGIVVDADSVVEVERSGRVEGAEGSVAVGVVLGRKEAEQV